MVMMAVEHRGKVIFKLLLCKNWVISGSYFKEAMEVRAFIKIKYISHAHVGSCSHHGFL